MIDINSDSWNQIRTGSASERYRRHEEIRIRDLYRVNFEVNNLEPFACLAFPQTTYLKTPRKQPIFGDELVTSLLFLRPTETVLTPQVPAEDRPGDLLSA
jgi:hypothetical protein